MPDNQREPTDEEQSQQVAGQHDRASGIPVGERAEQRFPEHPGQVRDGERQCAVEQVAGLVEHEQGDGDAGGLVAQVRHGLRDEQTQRLAVGQDAAVGAMGGRSPAVCGAALRFAHA